MDDWASRLTGTIRLAALQGWPITPRDLISSAISGGEGLEAPALRLIAFSLELVDAGRSRCASRYAGPNGWNIVLARGSAVVLSQSCDAY